MLMTEPEQIGRMARGGVDAVLSAMRDGSGLLRAAQNIRDRTKGRTVSFSKKAFVNLVNLCRDTCTYCTYKSEPAQQKISMMSKRQVCGMLDLAAAHRCTEILLVTGERPEERYPEARAWLRENGFASTIEFLQYCSKQALRRGLFPHTNAGSMTRSEIKLLRDTNPSIGLMLESSSGRLAGPGGPHRLAPSKDPERRIEVLRDAGRLGMPTTTGILCGIGETAREAVESLVVIRDLHKRYGHIQEVILQNFRPKNDTAMRSRPAADASYFKRIVAASRILMPDMNIQIPPNLSPDSYDTFLDAGINDWGGISPITPDFVNPELPWPKLEAVAKAAASAGFRLRCRFPVYPEFVHMAHPSIRERMEPISDSGYVRDEYWRGT